MSLRNAFLPRRSGTNLTYIRVSRNGYLNFRLRKFMFPLRNRYKNGDGNAFFHPVSHLGILTAHTLWRHKHALVHTRIENMTDFPW